MDLISALEAKYMKDDIPEFNPGDTLKVSTKIKEGDKERIQAFEGVVIQRRGKGTGESFTLRKISSGTQRQICPDRGEEKRGNANS
jgi:large subunit ribosomal protein L19